MADAPFTMLAHAFYEALWDNDRPNPNKRRDSEDLCGFIDALLDAGDRGNRGEENWEDSWETIFQNMCDDTCLAPRFRRALQSG